MTLTPQSFPAAAARRRRRGSTFLLVLSVLALVILISTTLTYTSRLETISARSYVDMVGARIAVASGLQAAPPFLRTAELLTATTQPWARPLGTLPADDPNLLAHLERRAIAEAKASPDALDTLGIAHPGARPAADATTPDESAPSVAAQPRRPVPSSYSDRLSVDLSGRLNINIAGSMPTWNAGEQAAGEGLAPHELNLERTIRHALRERGLDASRATPIARAIIEFRLGADGRPGAAGLDDDLNGANARPESDGVDNDGDGTVDNPEERDLGVARLDSEIPWVAESLRTMGADARAPFFAAEHNGLDDRGAGTGDQDDDGVDDPAEARTDFRRVPAGDDQFFASVAWLRRLPEVTPEIYDAIAPHLTTFSTTRNAIEADGVAVTRLNLLTASVEEIVEHLRAHYRRVDDRLLVQFACNVADYRDPDSARTEYSALDGTRLLGVERVPFITEVYPNARTLTEDGDDGQYVEIHNPWAREIVLAGWTLEVGGQRHALSQKLPPGATLLVTDDYNDSNDPEIDQDSAGSYGSLFGIFAVVPSGLQRQILEVPTLSIPDARGIVRLFDAKGTLADEFEYSGTGEEGTTLSFQRLQPAVAFAARRLATPFAQLEDATATPVADRADLFVDDPRFDRLFRSPADLMRVSSSWFATADQTGTLWQRPSLAEASRNIDASLTDLFHVAPPVPRYRPRDTDPEILRTHRLQEEARARDYRDGLININTASGPVLMALPGMTERLAEAILLHRDEVVQYARRENQGLSPEVPFARPSALLTTDALWQGVTFAKRLESYGRMANLITVSSSAFEVTSIILERGADGRELVRRHAARGIVALDEPGGRVVTFEFVR